MAKIERDMERIQKLLSDGESSRPKTVNSPPDGTAKLAQLRQSLDLLLKDIEVLERAKKIVSLNNWKQAIPLYGVLNIEKDDVFVLIAPKQMNNKNIIGLRDYFVKEMANLGIEAKALVLPGGVEMKVIRKR